MRVHLPSGEVVEIDAESAMALLASSYLGLDVTVLSCRQCGELHLDRDLFAVRPHRRHQCQRCGRYFWDQQVAVSNGLAGLDERLGGERPPVAVAPGSIDLNSAQYAEYQLWASTPALVWTSPVSEMQGIHVHAIARDGTTVDETYGEVSVDGRRVDAEKLRLLMVQRSLPYLRGRITVVACPTCGAGHHDEGLAAFQPANTKVCRACGEAFTTPRRRKVVSNPIVRLIEELGE